jgi:phosphomannomutase
MRGDAVKNCSTSFLVDKVAAALGFVCHEVDVGFKNISSKLKETDALIGGEGSGGLTVRGYIFGKDGVFSAMLFTEMQIVMNKPVSRIVSDLYAFAGYGHCISEIGMALPSDAAWEEIKQARPRLSRRVRERIVYNDNVKYVFGKEGWLLFRKSGTEPVIRIVAEMPSRAQAAAMLDKAHCFVSGLSNASA